MNSGHGRAAGGTGRRPRPPGPYEHGGEGFGHPQEPCRGRVLPARHPAVRGQHRRGARRLPQHPARGVPAAHPRTPAGARAQPGRVRAGADRRGRRGHLPHSLPRGVRRGARPRRAAVPPAGDGRRGHRGRDGGRRG
ncbi:hypothetical protein SGPA1_20486 [Streptomyces misionensis JCM 4497]